MRQLYFCISVLFLLFSCSKNKSNNIIVKRTQITESVYASGVIKAIDQYVVYSTVNGILKETKTTVGQQIIQGQVLFNLDADKAKLNEENSQLLYQLSQESNSFIQDKIAEMELKVQAAKDKLALDESIFNRNKRIKEFKVISEVDFERVELAYKSSNLNYETTKKQLAQLKFQLRNEQNRNAINLKISQKSLSDFEIKSAFSGQLFNILVKDGSLITTQTPLAVIGQTDAFLLELEVDENDMVRVTLGQKALVTLDSYKNKVFDAVIDKIYPIMDERSRTFKIEAHFVNPPKKLYPNLTAEANIIIQTKKNAIAIPKQFLLPGDSVFIDKDQKRKVKIGLNDYQNVEIIQGLNVGETIYQPR